MRLRGVDVAVIAILVTGLFVGAYFVWQSATPQSYVSKTKVTELRISSDGERVEQGFITANLVVNQRDELTFKVNPEDYQLPANKEKNIPPGSKVKFKSVKVTLRPAGNPYVHGPVKKRGFIYDDKGYESSTRLWKYWSLASPQWTARHVPYQVKVTDPQSGTVLTNGWKTFVSGYTGWDDGAKVELPRGMELASLGELLNGVTQPSSDYAYIYNVKSGTPRGQFVKEGRLSDKFSSNKPGARFINIVIAKANTNFDNPEKFDISDDQKSWTYEVHPSGLWNDSKAWLEIRDITVHPDKLVMRVHFDYWEEVNAPTTDFTTVFSVPKTDGFKPDKYKVEVTEYQRGTEVKNAGVHDLTNGTAKLVWTGSGQSSQPGQTVKLTFWGACDEWSEFVEQTGISDMSSITAAEQGFVDSRTEVVGIPNDVVLWTPSTAASFHQQKVPTTHYSSYDESTNKVCVYKLPQGGSRAVVQFKAPADVYDAIVFRPPYGNPKVTNVSDLSITSGETGVLTATVKNIGYTGSTFETSIDLPEKLSVVSPPGQISVPAGSERTVEWVISAGQVEGAVDLSGTVNFKDINSLKTGSSSFSAHIKPSKPPTRTGTLSVSVLYENGTPVAGALCSIAGKSTRTDSTGVAVVKSIATGRHKLTVTKGRLQATKTVTIAEGQNRVSVTLSAKPRPKIPWVWAIVGVGIAGAVATFIILRRKEVIEV